MRKKRKFYRGAVNHVYQKTLNGVQLFYCIEDCLVFYTMFSVCAKSASLKVLELCLMHNHFHCMTLSEPTEKLSEFMDHFSAWFVREYNTFIGRKGKLFKKNFGSAPKWDEKRLRSAIIYIGNNPVEKKFCRKAIESRWNFLAYAHCSHPFSKVVIKRKASHELKKALMEVDSMVSLNLPMKYRQLIRLTRKLSMDEKEQLADYIISQYSPFDYNALSSYFKSFESMLEAMNATTGDDYDIKESRDSFSLNAFNEMMQHMERKIPRHEIRRVTAQPMDEKIKLFKELQAGTSASKEQICNFLHIIPIKDGN